MAFTKALYYPWIEIKDEGWLKNAMLYWDKIQTIVPESIPHPYKNRTSREFFDEGLLIPFHVESSMQEIVELTDDVIKYLETSEGAEMLMSKEIVQGNYIHPNKLPQEIRRLVDLHPNKLPYAIEYKLSRFFSKSMRPGWFTVDGRFANFYMTLLATHLSEKLGAGLLTDTAVNNKLANTVKLDAKMFLSKDRRYRRFPRDYRRDRYMPFSVAQGALADLIFEKIQIDPKTSVKKIIKFRNNHADSLGQFRTKIAELTASISKNLPLDALRQKAEDIYINDVTPAINSLKKGLTDNRIKWATEGFLKVGFFSTSSTSIPLVLLGVMTSHALLVGAGLSLTTSAILYNRKKSSILRKNPYSYLLAAKRKFS